MRNVRIPPWHPRLAITMLIVLLAAGCQGRLAQQDEYFAPFSGAVTAVKAETEGLVMYHEALHALRRPCTGNPSSGLSEDEALVHGPLPGGASVGEARQRSCIPSTRTSAAYGSAVNAYIRWVQDRVRPLPDPSETASSIAGGS